MNVRVSSGQLRSIIREALLNEEVFGAQAFVYHGSRTGPEKFLPMFLEDKFDPGQGAGSMYGRGLYTVYDLKGTNTERGRYGPFIYKFKINLNGFIIFDADVTRLVYKRDITPAEQAKSLGLDRATVNFLGVLDQDEKWSSDQAKDVQAFLKGKVKGIVFTGRNDGKVAVIYDAGVALLVGWKEVDDESFQPVDKEAMKAAAGRSAADRWQPARYENPVSMKYSPKTQLAMLRVAKEHLNDVSHRLGGKVYVERKIAEELEEHFDRHEGEAQANLDTIFSKNETYISSYYDEGTTETPGGVRPLVLKDWLTTIESFWDRILEESRIDIVLSDWTGNDLEGIQRYDMPYLNNLKAKFFRYLAEETWKKMKELE